MDKRIILCPIELDELVKAITEAVRSTPTTERQPLEIIDRAELCKRLGLSEPTAIRYGKSGKIPEIRLGSSVRYSWYKVIEALEKGERRGKR